MRALTPWLFDAGCGSGLEHGWTSPRFAMIPAVGASPLARGGSPRYGVDALNTNRVAP